MNRKRPVECAEHESRHSRASDQGLQVDCKEVGREHAGIRHHALSAGVSRRTTPQSPARTGHGQGICIDYSFPRRIRQFPARIESGIPCAGLLSAGGTSVGSNGEYRRQVLVSTDRVFERGQQSAPEAEILTDPDSPDPLRILPWKLLEHGDRIRDLQCVDSPAPPRRCSRGIAIQIRLQFQRGSRRVAVAGQHGPRSNPLDAEPLVGTGAGPGLCQRA